MAAGEERHRDRLAALYEELAGQAGTPPALLPDGVMEGGIELDRGGRAAEGKETQVSQEHDHQP